MQIAQIKEYSLIYGFEPSFVLWTQGCPLHCSGCCNKDTWDFKGGFELEVTKILESITLQKNHKTLPIGAVCILGGEPLAQYESLLELLEGIRNLGLRIVLYSGYEKQEILEAKKDRIFGLIDVLISGRYVKELHDNSLQLRGSSNQAIDFFSSFYSKEAIKEGNYCEIEIDALGETSFFGYPYIFLDEAK